MRRIFPVSVLTIFTDSFISFYAWIVNLAEFNILRNLSYIMNKNICTKRMKLFILYYLNSVPYQIRKINETFTKSRTKKCLLISLSLYIKTFHYSHSIFKKPFSKGTCLRSILIRVGRFFFEKTRFNRLQRTLYLCSPYSHLWC